MDVSPQLARDPLEMLLQLLDVTRREGYRGIVAGVTTGVLQRAVIVPDRRQFGHGGETLSAGWVVPRVLRACQTRQERVDVVKAGIEKHCGSPVRVCRSVERSVEGLIVGGLVQVVATSGHVDQLWGA